VVRVELHVGQHDIQVRETLARSNSEARNSNEGKSATGQHKQPQEDKLAHILQEGQRQPQSHNRPKRGDRPTLQKISVSYL
jgi:hypothetical protein